MPYMQTLCLADSLFGFLRDLMMAEGSKSKFLRTNSFYQRLKSFPAFPFLS